MAKKTSTVSETKAPAAKPVKAPKKAAAQAPTAKADRKPRITGLRSYQIKILKTLAKSKNPLSRPQIAEKSGINSQPQINIHGIGTKDPVKRAAMEKRSGIVTLLTLKYVKLSTIEVNGREIDGYAITPAGTAALKKSGE